MFTACGGSSGSSATSTTSGNATTASTTPAAGGTANNAAFAKYTACLKKNGVTLPNFGAGGPGAGGGAPPTTTGGTPPQGGGPPGGNNAKFQKAQTACAKYRPAGARGAGGPGFGGGQNNAAFAAYRNCLTIHGVKLSAVRPGSATTTNAKVQKALTACASLRPARTAPPASTTTTSQ